MRKDIASLLKKLQVKPGKSLGQNFMADENFLDFIIREANPKSSDIVLEIGPGLGAFTRRLITQVLKLYAIELDIKLFSYLKDEITSENFFLFHGDALKFDYKAILTNCDFRIISNLPYSISTPLIMCFIELNLIPHSMHLILQEELADRFCALPSSKNYGASTVILNAFFEIKKIRRIPPELFMPKPDVYSAFVGFFRKKSCPTNSETNFLIKAVKASFSKRRKKLFNNLTEIFPKEIIGQVFEKFSLNQNVRAEELSPELFLEIAKCANPAVLKLQVNN